MRVYAGTIPVSADTELSSNPILIEWSFANPAFAAAVAGIASANAVADAAAQATGDATFLRLLTSAGVVIAQDTAGDPELGGVWGLMLVTRHIIQGVIVPLLGLTYTQPSQ